MKTHRKYRIVQECGDYAYYMEDYCSKRHGDYFCIEVKKFLFWFPLCCENGERIIYTSNDKARDMLKCLIRQERMDFVKHLKEKRVENNRKKSRKVIYEV